MFWILLGAVILMVSLVPLHPRLRRKGALQAAETVARSVGYVDAGPDWPSLYARMERRYVGGHLGLSVGMAAFLAAIPAMSQDTLASSAGFLGLLVVSTGRTTGTIVGHLRSLRPQPGKVRLATLRRRELRDYLVPAEAMLLRIAPLVPIATIVLGLALSSGNAVPQVEALGLVLGGTMGLVVGLVAIPLARRTLTAPADATTPGGLAWAEVLRAIALRDIWAGMWSLAATGSLLPLIPLFTDGPAVASWTLVPGVGIGVAATTVICGLAWVAASDINHQWARRHALGGVV